jgi:hypothetical protein
MARGLNASTLAILNSGNFILADLVEMQLDTPLYFTSAGYDLTTSTDTSSGTQTFIAQGNFMQHSAITEREQPNIGTVNITFTGVPATFRNIALTDDFLHKEIRIYKAFFSATDLSSLVDPVLWYSGRFTGASVVDSSDTSTVLFKTSAHFADFDFTAGRKTNDGSQQRFFPGDKFFEYSTEAIQDLAWGKS